MEYEAEGTPADGQAPSRPPLWFTSLARPLELGRTTNRLIAALAVAGLVGGSVHGWLSGGEAIRALTDGGSLALTIFLSWALARELDPDGEAAAFIAVGLSVAAWLSLGRVDLWALGIALGACRMVARTTGPPAAFGDALIVFAATGVLAIVGGRWSLAAVAAMAFALDALLVDGKRSRLVFAVLALGSVGAAVAWSRAATLSAPAHPVVLGVVAVAGVVGVLSLPPPMSPADNGEHSLHRQRIVGAQLVALTLVGLAALEPSSSVPATGVIAAIVGTVLGRALPRTGHGTARPEQTG